jgi:hypothetical protein
MQGCRHQCIASCYGPEIPSFTTLSSAAKFNMEQPMMRQIHTNSRSLLLIALPALVLACGGSSEPASTPIAGNYAATTFLSTGASGQRNELMAGSTLTLNLAANGTTTGHFHFVPPGSDPVFEADMAGTWTATGNLVDVDQPADTFVRDMQFTWGNNVQGVSTLTGDKVFSGTRIQITLTRAP